MIGTAMAVASVAQGAFSFASSKSARKKMRKARKAAMLEHDRATRYTTRQMEKEATQTIGAITQDIYASNLQMKGTPKAYRSAVEQELAGEMREFKHSAAAERANIRASGSAAMGAVKAQGTSALLGSVGQAISYGAGAFSSPSGKPTPTGPKIDAPDSLVWKD